jgi:hypothetical protein
LLDSRIVQIPLRPSDTPQWHIFVEKLSTKSTCTSTGEVIVPSASTKVENDISIENGMDTCTIGKSNVKNRPSYKRLLSWHTVL